MDPSRRLFLFGSASFVGVAALACRNVASAGAPTGPEPTPAVPGLPADPDTITKLVKTDDEWKALLNDAEAYDVLRHQGTERAFTGRYWNNHADGTYLCRGCGLRLFSSADKFDSGTGWPSFTRPLAANRVETTTDTALGMVRNEVHCARCDGHMGHVFDDGPRPTGLRYCMDSASLVFEPKKA